jgi:hypothetical protein
MYNNYISFIGTSRVTEHHITAAKKNGFKVLAISSSRKNSKYLKTIAKNNNIKKIFYSYKKCIEFSNKEMNISYSVTCRLTDNIKVLNELLKYKKKIFIEKPVFSHHEKFKKFEKLKKYIFVGYNRIFYKIIRKLKKKINYKIKSNVLCVVPEVDKNNISLNSCHIISIIQYLFGDLKILDISRNDHYINVKLRSKTSDVHIFFNFCASENFEIKIFNDKKILRLCPIEKLSIYRDFKILNSKGMRKYIPKIIYEDNEVNNGYKQGFVNQYKAFKLFLNKNKNTSDINFAERVIKICNKIQGNY